MTTTNHYAGTFRVGDTLLFHVSARTDVGADEPSYAPNFYDVYRISDSTKVITSKAMVALDANYPEVYIPDSSDLVTLDAVNFPAGESFLIACKENTGANPSIYKTISFKMEQNTAAEEDQMVTSTRKIDLDEVADSVADDDPNTVFGRLHTVEENQEQIIFPRLKRLLGLAGEHQLVDAYTYDEAGNITECRVRIFNTKANREAASPWLNRGGETDPAPALETGEITRYTVAATHRAERNLRNFYQGQVLTSQADDGYTTSVM